MVSIQVRGCKTFVTQMDCAPELIDRRNLQAIRVENFARRKNSRAVFVRFSKVTGAG